MHMVTKAIKVSVIFDFFGFKATVSCSIALRVIDCPPVLAIPRISLRMKTASAVAHVISYSEAAYLN